MPFLFAALTSLAVAGQTAFETSAGPRDQSFQYAWVDAEGGAHRASFVLPAAAVARELAEPVRLPLRQLADAQVAGVEAYARSVDGPRIEARAGPRGTVAISVAGRDRGRMKAALEAAESAGAAARAAWLEGHGWAVDRRGRLRPDHAGIAAGSAEDVRPVARALGMLGVAPREGLATALSFVQAIRYERHQKGKNEAGFRRPLATLAVDRADCDGKATLFLALARAAYPDLGVAIAYIPNHAFAGVAIEPAPGERTFRKDRVRYVIVEPVGPALTPLGDGSGPSRRHAALGAVDVVPVP